MPITTLSPAQARAKVQAGARLVDIRSPDEHARERIPGAVNVPLDKLATFTCDGGPVVFHCRSGMRTGNAAQDLARAAGDAPAFILDGGLDAWRREGHPTLADKSQPLEIMRQVQIAAGSLVLIGVLFGLLFSPVWFGLSAFVGAGLTFAGVTGFCGMARLLMLMPWNRPQAA